MKIAVDKNQFSGSHGKSNSIKHKQMENMGAILVPIPLPFGDYCKITDEIQSVIDSKKKICKKDLEAVIPLSIDTKKDLQELYGNVCAQHERFKRELLKPINNQSKLVILCEHGDDVKCLEDVYFFYQPEMERFRWVTRNINGRTIRMRERYMQKEIKGISLFRSLCTIRDRYNVQFEFCDKKDTGKRIMEILSDGQRNN